MQFAIIVHDKPGSGPLRSEMRQPHLDYWGQVGEKLVFGGPLLGEDDAPCGGILIVEAADEAEARALLDKDPFVVSGLFASITISKFRHVLTHGKRV
jgi:uncharacterized protein YciI